MPTKAQVLKAARLKVRKAADKLYSLMDAVKVAEVALKQSHKDFKTKTGISYLDFVSQQTNKAFEKRVGPKEVERLRRLASCHDLANALYKVYPHKGLGECRDAAWKHLGWNADCSKKIKSKAGEFVANCPHCHKPNIFTGVTKNEVENDYDFTCDNDRCIKQSRLSHYEKVQP